MKELSLHIMDIVENGQDAGATRIWISVLEDRAKNRLRITVRDNGKGIPEKSLQKVTDPFFTTRRVRRVGLGLSLFREASRRCGGEFTLRSKEGEGTEVSATFQLDHIDLAPMGDLAGSLACLILGHPEVDIFYRHDIDGKRFQMDTREVKRELGGVPITEPGVLSALEESIRKSIRALKR